MARVLSERDAAIIRDMYRVYRSWGGDLPTGDYPVQRDETFFGIFETPAGGIPAMADDVPGEADCIVYWYDIDGDGVLEAAGDGTETETVCNRFGADVSGATIIFAARDPWGTWWYLTTDAGDSHYKTPPGGIPKAYINGSGVVTLGSAECERYDLDATAATLTASGITRTVYNSMTTAVAGNVIVNTQLEQGLPIVIVEPCEADYDTGTGMSQGFSDGFGGDGFDTGFSSGMGS